MVVLLSVINAVRHPSELMWCSVSHLEMWTGEVSDRAYGWHFLLLSVEGKCALVLEINQLLELHLKWTVVKFSNLAWPQKNKCKKQTGLNVGDIVQLPLPSWCGDPNGVWKQDGKDKDRGSPVTGGRAAVPHRSPPRLPQSFLLSHSPPSRGCYKCIIVDLKMFWFSALN